MILTSLQNFPRNVRDLGKLIAAKGFKKLPKVQKIAKSGHTAENTLNRGKYQCATGLDKIASQHTKSKHIIQHSQSSRFLPL